MHSPFRHAGSVLRKGRAIHLTFFLTRRCNLRCPFCFYLNGQEPSAESLHDLTIEEITKISSPMGKLLWLAFSGGEIYLRDDLVEISEVFYRNNKPAIMLYPTNGMLPELIRERTEQILRMCKKSVIAVKLSLDGMKEMHDSLRGKKGSFDKVMATYHTLEGLMGKYPHFELGINTVFCSENQDCMDQIIDYVASLKNIRTHTISLIRGNPSREKSKNVDIGKYHNAIGRLEENLKKRISPTYRFRGGKFKAAQDILQRRLIHQTTTEQKRVIPCYAGRLNLVLTETGEVSPCELLTTSLGNIRDYAYNMTDLLDSDAARDVLRSIEIGQCYCTHECYFMTNILFNPLLFPALIREYLQI
ncbi:MAG TPA: radical SAM protein [Thermodesulfovibrionales bacterium]|nr:radical SAM protein [Thermodesulfovibrionales bacterium]